MKYPTEYLKLLIGCVVINVEYNTSTTIAIKDRREDPDNIITSIAVQIFFKDFILSIENPITILPKENTVMDLRGLTVIDTIEEDFKAELIFDNGYRLVIDMTDEAYTGPEAMSLSGPNNFCAVWN